MFLSVSSYCTCNGIYCRVGLWEIMWQQQSSVRSLILRPPPTWCTEINKISPTADVYFGNTTLMGVKHCSSDWFSRAMALQYDSQFATRDAWFKEEETDHDLLFPLSSLHHLLMGQVCSGRHGMVQLCFPTLESHCDPVTSHAVHSDVKVAFSPEF